MTRQWAYVCSPYRGDVENNVKAAREYCKYVMGRGYIPVCPHLFYPQFLNDDIPEEREMGIQAALWNIGGCEKVFVFLNSERYISDGMLEEIKYAQAKYIPIEIISYRAVAKALLAEAEKQ
jgi:hypothetical protein